MADINIKLSKERTAGLIFVGACVLAIILIAMVFGSKNSRYLRYSVLFDKSKGLKQGELVTLNEVAIGIVEQVDLIDGGEQVEVRVRIDPEHKEKIKSDSTAYIASSNLVSGEKVVEIHNPGQPSGTMGPNRRIDGKDSTVELWAWQASEKVQQWGETISAASKDLAQGAREITGDVMESATGIKDAAKDTAAETVKESVADDASDTVDAVTSDEFKVMLGKLKDFLGAMASRSSEGLAALMERWRGLKAELVPFMQKLKDSGKDLWADQLERFSNQIEDNLEKMEEGNEDEPIMLPTPVEKEEVPLI